MKSRLDIYKNERGINTIKIIKSLKNKKLLLNKIVFTLIKTKI